MGALANQLRPFDWLCFESEDEPYPEDIADLLTYVNYWMDCDEISQLQSEILDQLKSWVKVGVIAHKIKVKRLYLLASHDTKSFQEYCEKILHRNLWSVNRLIESSFVVLQLAQAGFTVLPQCEAQARPLIKFVRSGELISKWQQVVEACPPEKITAAKISEIVDLKPIKKKINISPSLYEQLLRKAALSGKSSEELLAQLINDYEPEDLYVEQAEDVTVNENIFVELLTPVQWNNWQQDLQKLLIERYSLAN